MPPVDENEIEFAAFRQQLGKSKVARFLDQRETPRESRPPDRFHADAPVARLVSGLIGVDRGVSPVAAKLLELGDDRQRRDAGSAADFEGSPRVRQSDKFLQLGAAVSGYFAAHLFRFATAVPDFARSQDLPQKLSNNFHRDSSWTGDRTNLWW